VLRGVDGRARLGDRIRCHTDLGQGDTDQTIAGEDFDQLVLGPALGSFWANGHHHKPMLLIGVLYSDLDVLWQEFAIGILIIVAVALDQWIRRISK